MAALNMDLLARVMAFRREMRMPSLEARLLEERPPKVTGEDGYKAVEIALAAYESAESGRPVGLSG